MQQAKEIGYLCQQVGFGKPQGRICRGHCKLLNDHFIGEFNYIFILIFLFLEFFGNFRIALAAAEKFFVCNRLEVGKSLKVFDDFTIGFNYIILISLSHLFFFLFLLGFVLLEFCFTMFDLIFL